MLSGQAMLLESKMLTLHPIFDSCKTDCMEGDGGSSVAWHDIGTITYCTLWVQIILNFSSRWNFCSTAVIQH